MNERSWELVTAIGLRIRQQWQELADNYDLSITHTGLPALAAFSLPATILWPTKHC